MESQVDSIEHDLNRYNDPDQCHPIFQMKALMMTSLTTAAILHLLTSHLLGRRLVAMTRMADIAQLDHTMAV